MMESVFRFSTDLNEIFSKCWILDFLKPHKISALLDNFFFTFSKGGIKEKNYKKEKLTPSFVCIPGPKVWMTFNWSN